MGERWCESRSRGLVLSVGRRKGVALLAVVAIGVREQDLSGMKVVPSDIGVELRPPAGLTGAFGVIINPPAQLAHRNHSGRSGIGHGVGSGYSVVPAGRDDGGRVAGC